jgi:hypothetical protein
MFTDKCVISKYLAYTMLTYTFASIFYFFMTKKIGTPFKDSLTQEQLVIKKTASSLRGNIFCKGIIISLYLIYIFKPFESC